MNILKFIIHHQLTQYVYIGMCSNMFMLKMITKVVHY